MKITIEDKVEMEFSLYEGNCLQHDSGTLFECESGDLFITASTYSGRRTKGSSILVMLSSSGLSFHENWPEAGYRRFKLVGKMDIEFKWPD